MKHLAVIVTVLTLAACGVDGPPVAPAAPGVSISGSVEFGIDG